MQEKEPAPLQSPRNELWAADLRRKTERTEPPASHKPPTPFRAHTARDPMPTTVAYRTRNPDPDPVCNPAPRATSHPHLPDTAHKAADTPTADKRSGGTPSECRRI